MSEVVTTTPETTAPVVEAPAPTPSAAPVEKPATSTAPAAAPTESKPQERRDTIRESMIKAGVIKPASQSAAERARDQQGRFAPAQAAAPAPSAPAAPQAPIQVEDLPLPKSLKKELETHWKSVPQELKKAYIERDSHYDRGISQLRTRAEAGEQILNEIKPFEHVFRATGTSPQATIKNLMPVAAVLATGTPEQKAVVISKAMAEYGVTVDHLNAALQGQQNSPMMHPEVQALSQKLQRLESLISSGQQRSVEAENQRISLMADAFGKDKPNFDEMRPQMWSLLQAQSTAEAQGLTGPLGSKQDTALWSESQWIENAYSAALRLNPAYFQSEIARQRDEALKAERDKANQAAQTSRAASVQVRGAPGGPASPAQVNPKDRQAVIRAALRAHST